MTQPVVLDPAPPLAEAYPPVFDPAAARTAGSESELEPAEADQSEAAAPAETESPPIDIVGLHGGQWFGRAAEAALRAADVLIGHARQLAVLPSDPALPGKPVELWGNLDEVLGFAAEHRAAGERACVLAAGDPGFFGLARLAAARLGDDAIRVHPAPSSVALAFARVGTNWDDALVVSAHGRPLEHAVAAAVDHPKVAVLVSKDQPPQALGQALLDAGCGDRAVAVCSRLGEADEQVTRTDLSGLAAGRFDPLSVVLVQAPEGARPVDSGMGLRWGRPEADFAHRDGMVTKAEVRAVALGKLGLPPVGTLWDVGAGSGSVAIECARLAPGLRIYAIERRVDDAERIRANSHGAALTVVEGTAPAALADLPDPDRAFVGGGGLDVLDAVLARLRPGGAVVATYATIDTAAAAAERLGNLVQVQVSRGMPVGPSGRLRLAAENPVFVCWGPT
jgi:precorrin-6Y C5,15-methyltransferase (decarboxylating)